MRLVFRFRGSRGVVSSFVTVINSIGTYLLRALLLIKLIVDGFNAFLTAPRFLRVEISFVRILYSKSLSISSAFSGDSYLEYKSQATSLVGGRYEIIMSDVVLKHSFKVDKFLGQVYLLVKKEDGGITWEKMIKDVAFNNPILSDKINYQLYMSGISIKYTFLINVNSGAVWQLVEDNSNKKNPILWWKLIETVNED